MGGGGGGLDKGKWYWLKDEHYKDKRWHGEH